MNQIVFFKSLIMLMIIVKSSVSIAQTLVVTLNDSSTEAIPLSEIKSVKFSESSMILYKLNGTVTSWNIDYIDNYSFDRTTSISSNNFLIDEKVNVFPNPSSKKVNIIFQSNITQHISVQIIDVSGKLVYTIYEGIYSKEKTFVWSPKSQGRAIAGNYFCKITTESKVITKPIMIQ